MVIKNALKSKKNNLKLVSITKLAYFMGIGCDE